MGIKMIECICRKCGRRNLFPDGIRPETYGWTEIAGDGWYCFKHGPESMEDRQEEEA